ncbi:MAG: phosphosulfolactate synthase [Marinilabiliaceae bacterium]
MGIMNFDLPHLPQRPEKPRQSGLTMMMDKGLSVRESENFVEGNAPYTDLIKLGFGTSLLVPNLEAKLNVYREAGIKTYFGGTLFEAFIVRGLFNEFRRYLDRYGMEYVEVSDGTITMPHEDKLSYIETLAKDYTVISEVGSKIADRIIPNTEWISEMNTELNAGAWKVIAEARESGTTGIYNKDGSANLQLIEDIRTHLKSEDILWEAPLKSQQVWFIKHFGHNVNLGNIAPGEVIPLETLRLGLRGDTLLDFIPNGQ